MDSEWSAMCSVGVQSRRIRRKKRNVYWEQVDEQYRTLIERFLTENEHLFASNGEYARDNNQRARETAELAESSNPPRPESILCNCQSSTLKFENAFLIPYNCSFQACDMVEGLANLYERLVLDKNRIVVSEQFTVIIDPPWICKSLKRKRYYETSESHEIEHVIEPLHQVLEIISNVQRAKFGKANIHIAIWTTNKYRKFAENSVLPLLEMKLTRTMLWHKVTKFGESSKIRGSPEFLVLGNSRTFEPNLAIPFEVVISVPSSIHSHKPPINLEVLSVSATTKAKEMTNVHTYAEQSTGLVENVLPNVFRGLELYARYLRPGFHSIGNEVLKLQNESLYRDVNM
ncbi:N(6)-adenine-specific methyltransferase METTL4 [Halotydeus destructor]|nr:N(6)-adenine-specific methyltransferase METTL4 [Halotydeus destructor]